MDSPLEISVLMPCLNEAETLETCIVKAQRFLVQHGLAGEVIVADNGSQDGSPEIARRLGARLVQVPTPGYGAAIRGGIAAARGKYVIVGDADDSYDFGELMPFVEKLRDDFDLVMGNRFQGEIKPGAMPLSHRLLGNPVLSGLGKLFFGSPCGDFHCGLRGFHKGAIEALHLETEGMEFASEMVVKATLNGRRITEVPITLYPDGRSRPPHLRSWRDGWRHLRFLLMHSPRWLFFYPGLLLIGAALLLVLGIFWPPRDGGLTNLDIQILLYSSIGILVGYQCLLFALAATRFAASTGLAPPEGQRIGDWFTKESVLVVGAALFFGGLAAALYALLRWSAASFEPQSGGSLMAVLIPAGLLLTIGLETIMNSFFLSVLGTQKASRDARAIP